MVILISLTDWTKIMEDTKMNALNEKNICKHNILLVLKYWITMLRRKNEILL